MPNGSILVARADGQSKKLFADSKKTKALVLLSMTGNKRCIGDSLGAMVKNATDNHQFSTFLIADEIHWHNLKNENTTKEEEQTLRQTANQLGFDYFNKQLQQFLLPLGLDCQTFEEQYPGKTAIEKIEIINQLAKGKFEIVLWRGWMDKAPSFYKDNQEKIANLYATAPVLKEAIEKGTQDYLSHGKRDEGDALLKLRSIGYLSEENFAIMWLSAYLGYNFILYPGAMPEHFNVTKQLYGENDKNLLDDAGLSEFKLKNSELLANWLHVSFREKSVPLVTAIQPKPEPIIEEIKPLPLVLEPKLTHQINSNQFFQPANTQMGVLDNPLQIAIETILAYQGLRLDEKSYVIGKVLSQVMNDASDVANQCLPKVF